MANLAVSHVFSTGDVVDATKFNTNYTTDIVGYVNARNAGTSSWENFYVTTAAIVPSIVDNSTGAYSIAQFKDNGTTVFEVHDGGFISSPYQSFLKANKSADQILTLGIDTKVTWESITQTESGWNAANNRYVINTPGKYYITATAVFYASLAVSGVQKIYIYKNGVAVSTYRFQPLIVMNSVPLSASNILNLATNDYIEIWVNSDVSLRYIINNGLNFFKIYKLS